jgi:DnaJ family protein A protein 2
MPIHQSSHRLALPSYFAPKYYAQVSKCASLKDIRTAYRRLAVKHHPDKGGDDQAFQEISAAYQVLGDDAQRKVYDALGLAGLRRPKAQSQHPADIFDYSTMGRRPRSASSPTASNCGPTVTHTLPLTLQDLYNGKTVPMTITRQVLVGTPVPCTACEGRGKVMALRRLGVGLVQRRAQSCAACQGQGVCAERATEQHEVQVPVERGMVSGERIVLTGLGDEQPNGREVGPVHFVVQPRKHAVFTRKGADLLVHKQLTLKEALTGFSFTITHLDERPIVVQSKPGQVMAGNGKQPLVKMIPNEGMPSRGNPFVRGNLYVHFMVKFPSDGELSPAALAALREHLPGPDSLPSSDDTAATAVHCQGADLRQFGKGGLSARPPAASESDEDTEQVQCQQS